MLIILEGPNGAGKTDLAGSLAVDLGLPTHKNEAPQTRQQFESTMQAYKALVDSGKDYIIDRVPCVSELAYSRIVDHRNPFCDLPYAIEFLSQPGVLFVYCNTATLKPRIVQPYEDVIVTNYKFIISEILYSQKVKTLIWDFKLCYYEFLLESIKEAMQCK